MRNLGFHIVPWIVFTIIILLSQKQFHVNESNTVYFTTQILLILHTVGIFYINYLLSVPRFLVENRKGISFAFATLSLILISVLFVTSLRYGSSYFAEENVRFFELFIESLGGGIISFMIIAISTAIRLIVQYYKEREKRSEMKALVRKAELDALKAQMNPHFLYNAFNTIYALAETKSTKTPEAVLQLADIMRYITYNSPLLEVSVFEELKFIQSYITFQKWRITDPEKKIKLNIQIPPSDLKISPLLLITFIENAFKHSNFVGNKGSITVDFESFEDGFIYRVTNQIFTRRDENSGIGLDTLEKILNYRYPRQFDLKTWEKDNVYFAQLNLKLNKNA